MLTGIPKVHPNSLVPRELQCLTLSQPLPCLSLFPKSQRNKSLLCHFIRTQYFSFSSVTSRGHLKQGCTQGAASEHHQGKRRVEGIYLDLPALLPSWKSVSQAGSNFPARFVLEMLLDPSVQWPWQVLPQSKAIIQSSPGLTSGTKTTQRLFVNGPRTPEIQLEPRYSMGNLI